MTMISKRYQNSTRQASELNPVLKKLIEQDPTTFERYVVTGLIQSYQFYREYRDRLCEFNEEKQTWRKDFRMPRYNTMYQAIDTFWRSCEATSQLGESDYFIPQDLLNDLLVGNANSGGVSPDVVRELQIEMAEDLYRPTASDAFCFLGEAAVLHWLSIRIAKETINRLHADSQVGFMRADEITGVVAAMTRGLIQLHKTSMIGMGQVADGSTRIAPRFPCSIPGLNTAIGGGFGRGEGTLIAGLPAGGKTVLAAQFAWDFIDQGIETVLVTTEQKPFQLVQRIISNAVGIKFSEFVNRADFDLNNLEEQEMTHVPAWVWNDPLYAEKARYVRERIGSFGYCLNWSDGGGKSITGHLDSEIERLETQGWFPKVIIFDWVGAALGQSTQRDHLRHLYQEAADALVLHGMRKNRTIITLAQLNKAKANNKKRITMDMVAECTSMANRYTNFIGISSLLEADDDVNSGTNRRLSARQFLNVDKARLGPGGLVEVEQNFAFQRFRDAGRPGRIRGGG